MVWGLEQLESKKGSFCFVEGDLPVVAPVIKGVKILLEKTSVSVASDRSEAFSVICKKKQSSERN